MGADEDLGSEVKGVKEVLVAIFDAFAFLLGHEVEVDGLASNDGAEGTVFHNNNAVAELGEEEGGLGGERILDNLGGCRNVGLISVYGLRIGWLVLNLGR